MSEDYLWDRSGPPDPEIEHLERKLEPLRYRPRAKLFPEPRVPDRRVWWAAAAALLLAAVAVWRITAPAPPVTGWQVASLEGTARMGGENASVSMQLRAGQVLRTASGSQLQLEADELGQIDLGPDSELRAASTRQIRLSRGKLHAFIWARPRQFVVDTESARAVDLGCEYTLNIDRSGDGLLQVSTGWVAFQFAGHESFIPEGAACVTRKRAGPGVPYYQDAPDTLRLALNSFETGKPDSLGGILYAARPRDALTLWHLLARVAERNRGTVYDRFAQLVTLPPEVSREGVMRLDPKMMDLCWDALHLENTEWWRGWERKWSE